MNNGALNFKSLIGVYVEPSAMAGGDASTFPFILTGLAISLAQNRLMSLTVLSEPSGNNRLQALGLIEVTEGDTDQNRLAQMFQSGLSPWECFREFGCYPGTSAGYLYANELAPAVDVVREKLAQLQLIECAEIAVIDLTDLGADEAVKALRSSFVMIHPHNHPLSFQRHIPDLQQ